MENKVAILIKNVLSKVAIDRLIDESVPVNIDLKKLMTRIETEIIQAVLDRNEKNQSQTARDLGIGRMALIQKMGRFKIK